MSESMFEFRPSMGDEAQAGGAPGRGFDPGEAPHSSVCECPRGGKHQWRTTYHGRRFNVIRCRRCKLLATEREGGVRV